MKKAKDSNPNRAGAKSKRVSNLAMILTAILGFYGLTTSAGLIYGRMKSPDWSDSMTLTKFVYDNHSWRLAAPASETSPAVVELWITGGDRKYVYRSDTDKVDYNFLPRSELAAVRTPTVSSDTDGQTLLKTATGALGAAFPLAKAKDWLAHLNEKYKRKYTGKYKGKYGAKYAASGVVIAGVAIVGCVAIVGGGAVLGYRWTYQGKEPDYGSEKIQSALMNSLRWREAAKQHLPPAVNPANVPDASPQVR